MTTATDGGGASQSSEGWDDKENSVTPPTDDDLSPQTPSQRTQSEAIGQGGQAGPGVGLLQRFAYGAGAGHATQPASAFAAPPMQLHPHSK